MTFNHLIHEREDRKSKFGTDAEIFADVKMPDKYSCFYDGIKDCCSGSCANYQQCVAQQEGF